MPKLTDAQKVYRATKKLVGQHPTAVIQAILEGAFWPRLLEPRLGYRRISDDTSGDITVSFSHDGDGWIEVTSRIDPEENVEIHRFRTGDFGGGGQSPRVRNALLVLAVAIKLDNEERPQLSRRKIEDGAGQKS